MKNKSDWVGGWGGGGASFKIIHVGAGIILDHKRGVFLLPPKVFITVR